MPTHSEIGLIASGSAGRGLLNHIPRLRERLGPVVSPLLRVSSRLSGMLNAGEPTMDWDELRNCRAVLLHLPPDLLPRAILRLANLDFPWQGRVVTVCQVVDDSSILGILSTRGAATASLSWIALTGENLFVLEGATPAVRVLRSILEGPGNHIFSLERGKKDAFLSAGYFSCHLLEPLLEATMEALRSTGLSPAAAGRLTQKLFEHTLRSYLRSRRKGWQCPLSGEDLETISEIAERTAKVEPALGRFLNENSALCYEFARTRSRKKPAARQLVLPGGEGSRQ